MNQQIIIWIALFIGLAGAFYTRGKTIKHDVEAANEVFTWGKFLTESWLDIVLSLGLYAGIITGASLGDLVPPESVTTVTGALIFGAGIPQIVSKWIMPIWGGGDASRKKIRAVIDKKTNIADRKS